MIRKAGWVALGLFGAAGVGSMAAACLAQLGVIPLGWLPHP